jgi:hypothetical protein
MWLNAIQATSMSGRLSYQFDGASAVLARVALIPVFAGTTVNGFLADHTSGTYPADAVSVVPVTLVPAEEMVADLWRHLIPAHKWRRNNKLSFALATLGGHMRLVETFVEAMLDRASLEERDGLDVDSWEQLRNVVRQLEWENPTMVTGARDSVADKFRLKYSGWLGKSRPQLLAATILGVPLERSPAVILDGDSIDAIVHNSPVAVSECPGAHIRLSFSPITLSQMCSYHRSPFEQAVLELYDQLLKFPLRVGFEAFEDMCAKRLAVQIMAADYFSSVLTLDDVFPGALFSDEKCRHLRFDSSLVSCADAPMKAVPVLRARDRFPFSPVVDACSGIGVEWDKPVVVVNASSAPFADVVARTASGLTLLVQCKRYFDGGVVVDGKKTSVVEEVKKYWDAMVGREDFFGHAPTLVVVYLSLGYGTGGKRLSAEDRASIVAADLDQAKLKYPTIAVFRGGGFEDLFGILANTVALQADECVFPAQFTFKLYLVC